jgi:BCCT family betaine/carnitine transporter
MDASSGGPNRGLEFLGLRVHRTVFPCAVALIVLAAVAALLDPAGFNSEVARVRGGILRYFDDFIMIMGNLFVLLCVVLALSPFGRVRLGGPDARPQFGFVSWFSMMFAAGMGVGLLYWGVAEPVAAFTGWPDTPLNVEPRTPAAAQAAMGSALFHWGVHPWAVYLVTALVVGYFAYNRGLPFAMSSALSPLLGRQHAGPVGQAVDVFAVVLSTFGMAASLGLGAMQSAAGMHLVLGTADGLGAQGLFIAAVCLIASISVWTGIDAGIRILSNLNMALATLLLAFCAVGIGVGTYVTGIFSALGDYARLILPLSDWRQRPDADWYHAWTVFYWAWWCSWGPLVGVFIARVSRGRSIRQMVAVVMVAPAAFALLWFTAFGGGAIAQVTAGVGPLAAGVQDVNQAIFQFLGQLPLTAVTSLLVIVLLVIFTVTSVDSGAVVADNMAANGRTDTPRPQRVLWVLLIGLVATALLVLGGDAGLKGVQSVTIVMALPYLVLMIVLIAGLLKALWEDRTAARGAP